MEQVRFYRTGGPEVLQVEEAPVPEPGPGEVLIQHEAIGLNFIDTYHRSGLYPVPLPAVPGLEGAGVIKKVGEGVENLQPGDRVAYGAGPLGAYAQWRTMPASRVARLPDAIDCETAAAMMLKGLTAWYLLRETFRIRPGDVLLFLPAAGGVGLIAGQWAKALGAVTIGACSSGKVEKAKAHGYDHVIAYDREDLAERVAEITDGRGVDVVYDGVGAATFESALSCLKRRGLMVSFGNASGPVTGVNLGLLAEKGSLYVTRPVLMDYVAEDADLARASAELFEMVASGRVRISIDQRYPLSEAAQAHADLEARRTTGQTILLP
ncbi:quinone oxidoreductase [Thermopetrobacter sp. TC1]|uniref:quinone oxidoreductase family protein n=1 Tax=Thermopetrobacter sp. TC1 TaxID=1495045 RepID=UPI00056F8ECE|nr:quinone oxidoreductase [Thermopetrobacter sp. TC1]